MLTCLPNWMATLSGIDGARVGLEASTRICLGAAIRFRAVLAVAVRSHGAWG